MQNQVQGLDASKWQSGLNWQQVAIDYQFAFIKATGGHTYIDPDYLHNWNEALNTNLIIGAYHFYYSIDSPEEQANHFITTVRSNMRPGNLPPALDLEGKSINSHISQEQFVADIKTWLNTVEQALGKPPIIYTDLDFAKHWLTDPSLASYPLWIAYPDTPLRLPAAWKSVGYAFWQNGKRSIDGIQFDYDTFNGNHLQLRNGEIINRPIQ